MTLVKAPPPSYSALQTRLLFAVPVTKKYVSLASGFILLTTQLAASYVRAQNLVKGSSLVAYFKFTK